jgi:hypothetical protein
MDRVNKISRNISAGKIISAISMIFLLVFLTCVNQFIYGSCDKDAISACSNSPAGPDEKSPDAPVSINEEYIHDHESPVNPFWANALFAHMIHEADKLTVVHFEILSPPPNA